MQISERVSGRVDLRVEGGCAYIEGGCAYVEGGHACGWVGCMRIGGLHADK